MKKLKLKALDLGALEILSRDQLKSITGGCSTNSDCGTGSYCYNGGCQPNGSDPGSGSGSGSGSSPSGDICGPQGLCNSYQAAGGAFCCCVPCGHPTTG